jgi:ribosomal protein L40E
MITKRELTDLRESIAQTLFDLKQPMPKYSTATRNKKICFSCGATLEPALPHQCRAAPKKAPLTKQFLKNNERNSRNLQ